MDKTVTTSNDKGIDDNNYQLKSPLPPFEDLIKHDI